MAYAHPRPKNRNSYILIEHKHLQLEKLRKPFVYN